MTHVFDLYFSMWYFYYINIKKICYKPSLVLDNVFFLIYIITVTYTPSVENIVNRNNTKTGKLNS